MSTNSDDLFETFADITRTHFAQVLESKPAPIVKVFAVLPLIQALENAVGTLKHSPLAVDRAAMLELESLRIQLECARLQQERAGRAS